MKSIPLKILPFFLAILTITACSKEEESMEDQLLGVWALSAKTIDNTPVSLTDCEKLSTIEFQEKNFCILYDGCVETSVNSGWNYKYDMLNIAEYLPVAFYVEKLDKSTLTIKSNDITSEGNLQVTIMSYNKIP
ncbi:MAG: lipocalin family protein [Bacteroidales bacterium]|nr:lipocalin family protein [Bacteroidales bacterium]